MDSFLAGAVYFLEGVEVELFVGEDVVVANLVPRLLLVELILKHVDFGRQLRQFVEELSLFSGVFLKAAIAILVATYSALIIGESLGLGLLGSDLLLAGLLVETARHEVLVRVQVLIEVDDLLECDLIWSSPHRLLCKRPHLLLV